MTGGAEHGRRHEAERQAVLRWYRAAGYEVVNFSRPGIAAGKHGRRGTMTTPGWPDLGFFAPSSLAAELGGKTELVLHEVKTGEAKLNPAQREMVLRLRDSGLRVIVGGVEEAKEELRRRGAIVTRDGMEVLAVR